MTDVQDFLQPDQLQPNPFQPRDKIKKEELQELVSSIKEHGILEPLVVAHTPAGYQIIAGERRWRAAKEAGLDKVPVIIKKTTPRGMLEMAIVENVQRSDLNPLERAQAFMQLTRNFGFSNQDIAKKVSKSTAFVSNTLRLLDLPDAIKDGLIGEVISEGHARALNGLPSDQAMIECYKLVLKEGASVRRTEELVRQFKEKMDVQTVLPGKRRPSQDQLARQWETMIKTQFRTKSSLKLNRSDRQTKVSIILKGNPGQTHGDLEKLISLISGEEIKLEAA